MDNSYKLMNVKLCTNCVISWEGIWVSSLVWVKKSAKCFFGNYSLQNPTAILYKPQKTQKKSKKVM